MSVPANLAAMQAAFQAALLVGDDAILAAIPNSPRETKETLLSVYRDGYVLRLLGILREDFARFAAYIGDDAFEHLARAFIAAYPSRTPNARYFGQGFAEYAAACDTFKHVPAAGAIARLEGALGDIFDIPDTAPLTLADLAAFAPEEFAQMLFTPHPSVRRLQAPCDLAGIFGALSDGLAPPEGFTQAGDQHLLVWRKDVTPHYRALADEEAMMWDEAAKGVRFGVLCEMLAVYDDPANAPLRAATYLQTWITSGLLASAASHAG